jgi:hypothetical protein
MTKNTTRRKTMTREYSVISHEIRSIEQAKNYYLVQ